MPDIPTEQKRSWLLPLLAVLVAFAALGTFAVGLVVVLSGGIVMPFF